MDIVDRSEREKGGEGRSRSVFGCGAEGAVDVDSGHNPADRGIGVVAVPKTEEEKANLKVSIRI